MINKTKDPPIKDQLKPERNKTNNPEQAMINAVPRSGCIKTKKKQLKISKKLKIISFLCIGNFLSNKKFAKNIGTASFSNSED